MGRYQIDPKHQFSKRLARWTAVFWFVYLIWLSILMMLEPSVAQYAFFMAIVVSVVMMVSVIMYTINSVTEKRIFGMLDKAQIELQFGPLKASMNNKNKDEENEEGDNG